MKKWTGLIATALLLSLLTGVTCAQVQLKPVAPVEQADPDLNFALKLQNAYTKVAAKTYPSVVCVTVYEADPAAEADVEGTNGLSAAKDAAWRHTGRTSPYKGFRALRSGSGFALDEDGYFLTARHLLLDEAGELHHVIDVETSDLRKTLCSVVGTEPTLNLALLKFEVFPKRRPPEYTVPKYQYDAAIIQPGQIAIAVGDPAGAVRTFAPGVFSATPNRQCYQNDLTSTFIQASLNVHPEAYGGPVVDLQGRVVGMLTPRLNGAAKIVPNPGIEFIMPIQILANIADTLKVKGSNQSPWLGFSILELATVFKKFPGKPGVARPYTGVYIDDVYDPSPAAKAGVQDGDFLVSFNGVRLFSVLDFQTQLYLAGIGSEVELELFNAGKTRTLKVKIEERPKGAITH